MSGSSKKFERWTFKRVLVMSFLARVFLILYAKIHDYMFEVSFTDVDYRVFSDAARLVVEEKSPFDRATYRYTPFLAWILTPNVWIPDFGKFLFCFLDCVTGYFLHKLTILDERRADRSASAAFVVTGFWLLNPFVAIISARGSADSLVCCAVLLTLYFLLQSEMVCVAAVVHGALAIHLKIYPVIYYPSVFLYLAYRGNRPVQSASARPDSWAGRSFGDFVWRCLSNQSGFIFIMLSCLFFCMTVVIGYLAYPTKFLEEFLFYHITRQDIRHNFSPYFYPLYLTTNDEECGDVFNWAKCLSLGSFIPQVVCIVAFALKYYNDLPFCWFLTTFAFVSFNKVCTSQYFIWYLCFLPPVYNRIDISTRKYVALASLWFSAQGVWLSFAYLFEFRGHNTLPYIWMASVLFLLVNCIVLGTFIRNYRHPPAFNCTLKSDNASSASSRHKKEKVQ